MLASSAPVNYFAGGLVPFGSFDYMLNQSLTKYCDNHRLFRALDSIAHASTGDVDSLNSIFHLSGSACALQPTVEDFASLRRFVHTALASLVEGNLSYSIDTHTRPSPSNMSADSLTSFQIRGQEVRCHTTSTYTHW